MNIKEFESIWATMTRAQAGAAVERYFHHKHPKAIAVRSNATDFELDGQYYDIKGHKSSCPHQNTEHKKNAISILWYNWMSASDVDGRFPAYKRSEWGTEEFERIDFFDFANFVCGYRKDKNKKKPGSDRPVKGINKRKEDYIKERIYQKLDSRFPGKNRYVRQKFDNSMESALVNGKYEKYDRTIAISTEDQGTSDSPEIVVKEWIVFEHNLPREEVIQYLRRHPIDEKYFATEEAYKAGIIKKHTEEIR